MQDANILEIGQAFADLGQVALWLGKTWQPPSDINNLDLVAKVDWIGVWSESRNAQLADRMELLWRQGNRPRQVIQVPDTLEEGLGSHFRFSDFAPYMFLHGKDGTKDALDNITREDSIVDKVRQLGRIHSCLLLIESTNDCQEALRIAIQAWRRAPELLRIVILNHSMAECEIELAKHEEQDQLSAKLSAYSGNLFDLITQISNLSLHTTQEVVQVGDSNISLVPLLREEPPITQNYAVLTASDIDPNIREGEDSSQLLSSLLSGTSLPWRAIANGFVWNERPEQKRLQTQIIQSIHQIRQKETKIIVIDINVEPGSGATVLLSQLAVFTAIHKCPTLFHLASETGISYPHLRTFLTDLYREITGQDALYPAVIFYDVDSSWNDIYGDMESLPNKLNRDGRRAVIIRAHQIGGFWAENFNIPRSTQDITYIKFDGTLRERMSTPDTLKLAGWFETTYHKINNSDSLPSDWYHKFESLAREAGCPLLIVISLLIIERYNDAVKLGDRILARLDRIVNAIEKKNVSEDDCVAKNMKRISIGQTESLTQGDIYSIAITLAAMGCLNVSIPRQVLAHLSGIKSSEIINLLLLLERAGLTLSKEPAPLKTGSAYCTNSSTVQLAHHAYGKLLLESIIENYNDIPFDFPNKSVASYLLDVSKKVNSKIGFKTIEFLQPIFKSLRPGNSDDRSFAEQLVQNFLRVHKENNIDNDADNIPSDSDKIFRKWQWANRDNILSAFEWIPARLIETSSSILHSRAITSAKCTRNENPTQARNLFMKAEDDLISAIEIASDSRSDNPACMLNTLGGVYVHWTQLEREQNDPEGRVNELSSLAEDTLREARLKLPDSTYSPYFMALLKVDTAQYLLSSCLSENLEKSATYLAEALELLSMEPSKDFETQWNELLRRAMHMLGDQGQEMISALKKSKKHLGWALCALRELNGEFPRERSPEIGEVELEKAWKILEDAFKSAIDQAPDITYLLRYYVFSARILRMENPAYDERLKYLEPISKSKYYGDDPILQYDYGMLLFQNKRNEEGAKVFQELRRGLRFYSIPSDRATTLTIDTNSIVPKQFRMQVQNVDSRTGQGWARIIDPERIPTPVPFGVRAFEARGQKVTPMAMIPCNVTIRPAGPFAEPIIKKQ